MGIREEWCDHISHPTGSGRRLGLGGRFSSSINILRSDLFQSNGYIGTIAPAQGSETSLAVDAIGYPDQLLGVWNISCRADHQPGMDIIPALKGGSRVVSRLQNNLSQVLLLVSLIFGLVMLFYPFLQPLLSQDPGGDQARAGEMPLLISLLLGLCLLVLILEAQNKNADTRMIALLGVLVAMNSVLRFIEVGIPGPGGFTPVFVLIILTGYIFTGSFGFLMGALTMFVSAIITGGVGPWLPGQMFTAGWVGMSAVLCSLVIRNLKAQGKSWEVYVLAGFSFFWGFAYGTIMNLWTWPFIVGPIDQYWTPGIGLADAIRRYLVYYSVTSLAWDLAGAAGNAILILVFGRPILQALRRFRSRFTFHYEATPLSLEKPG